MQMFILKLLLIDCACFHLAISWNLVDYTAGIVVNQQIDWLHKLLATT